MEPLFQVKVLCSNCEAEFKSSRVRPSFKKSSGSDTDFCLYYKEINPDYYVVRVCPFCGFASTESFSPNMNSAQKKLFQEKLGHNWSLRDYGGERSWDEALQVFKLALLCAQIKNEKERLIAGILHHIAWLYRHKNDGEQEKRFLQFALESYTRFFETEGNEVNDARLMYLIGELNRRLGNYGPAVRWFSRVVNDRRIMDSGMIRACREQWTQTREDMLAANMELPDDVKELK
ncbi:DUF2225 domain-containing protein [Paenibacillus thalictri]|uniref:DUF2225 domain-containing protein n=1 Tax=Paenibacillus thalictri TaxID=2527873 RepID=A0A4Q9DJC0_9BACL|nr:DUF2225 domain-containing protein [Paenibacillus thalictri]TBL74039.1 DUF2225 domain-containing protein [Paenibacillus thalictri]